MQTIAPYIQHAHRRLLTGIQQNEKLIFHELGSRFFYVKISASKVSQGKIIYIL